ncbi:Uncharacterised protein [Mycobacteroides abscessus subsp. abscessus]|nr:Uncharacterised protein [Mycobacteroides abscessus subsp. abscessus]
MDALQGGGIDEGAVAEAGGAGTVKLPRHQIIAIGGLQIQIMLMCSAYQTLFTCPGGAAFAQRGHGGGIAAGLGGDVASVAQSVQPAADTSQSPIGELADGGQDRANVLSDVEVSDGLSGDSPCTNPHVSQGLGDVFREVASYAPAWQHPVAW